VPKVLLRHLFGPRKRKYITDRFTGQVDLHHPRCGWSRAGDPRRNVVVWLSHQAVDGASETSKVLSTGKTWWVNFGNQRCERLNNSSVGSCIADDGSRQTEKVAAYWGGEFFGRVGRGLWLVRSCWRSPTKGGGIWESPAFRIKRDGAVVD